MIFVKMHLHNIVYFVSLFSIISGRHIRNKRDTYDPDYEAWLSELESQIIRNSEELQNVNSTVINPPDVPEDHTTPGISDHVIGEEVREPIVVTAKPYLTGEEDEKPDSSVTEKVEFSNSEEGLGNLPEGESQATNNGTHIREDGSQLIKNEDGNRVREILDKILIEIPKIPFPPTKTSLQQFTDENGRDSSGSEVGTFVFRMRNHTPMIILGCVLSLLTLIALVVTICQVIKKLNTNASVTLIAHYEHEDAVSSKTLKS